MEIKSMGDELNFLKYSGIRGYEIDGIMDSLPAKEVPHIVGSDISESLYDSDDSERKKRELPNISGNAEMDKPHSPMLTSMLMDSKDVYAPSMEFQAESIKEIYDSISELHYDKWKSLDINERKTVLNNFEMEIALVEKRPSMPVGYERLSNGVMGYNDGNKLVISEKIMNSNNYSDYKETLNTLFHEGRHSYQNYNLYVKRTESSDETFNAWVVNREKLGYSSGNASFPFNLNEAFRQKSFYQYFTQPVEVDARLFAETVENKIGLNTRESYD